MTVGLQKIGTVWSNCQKPVRGLTIYAELAQRIPYPDSLLFTQIDILRFIMPFYYFNRHKMYEYS